MKVLLLLNNFKLYKNIHIDFSKELDDRFDGKIKNIEIIY
jgi:hypothetical protein